MIFDVVDEGNSPVHVDHHDLRAGLGYLRTGGRWCRCRLRYGWLVQFMDEDPCWDLSTSRSQLRQDVRSNVVVADDMVELETTEFVLELAYLQAVRVHVLLVAIPGVVDFVDDDHGVAVDHESLDAEGDCQA